MPIRCRCVALPVFDTDTMIVKPQKGSYDLIKFDLQLFAEPVSEAQKERLSLQLNKLNEVEKETITWYTRFGAQTLNGAINDDRITEAIQKKIDILNNALSKGVIDEELTLIRKTIPEYIPFPDNLKANEDNLFSLISLVLTNKSFISSSLIDFNFPLRNVIMTLKVPKGYKGAMYIKKIATPKYQFQEEVLFKTGMEYKVLSVEKKGKFYYMSVEVIP